jgi:hypothetical protein
MAILVDSANDRADRHQLELLRAATPAQRLRLARSMSATAIDLARSAIRARHPELSEQEVLLRFVEVHYGAELAAKVRAHLVR